MPRRPRHEEARDRCALFVAALLQKLADARHCEVKHLSAADVEGVERIVLLIFNEGIDFAHDRPTIETPMPFPKG